MSFQKGNTEMEWEYTKGGLREERRIWRGKKNQFHAKARSSIYLVSALNFTIYLAPWKKTGLFFLPQVVSVHPLRKFALFKNCIYFTWRIFSLQYCVVSVIDRHESAIGMPPPS